MSEPAVSAEDGASSEALAKIRFTLLAALQETERIEEAFQGLRQPDTTSLTRASSPHTAGGVNERLSVLIKLLSGLDDHANVLDPDHLTVPSDILASLAKQSVDSVSILADVKTRIDRSAAKAKAQIAPVNELRSSITEMLNKDREELDMLYRNSLTARGLMNPPFLR